MSTNVQIGELPAAQGAPPPSNQPTRDMCRELGPAITPVQLRAAFDELNGQIKSKLDVYVTSARKAEADFDALLPELDRMQAMLSQRGRLRGLMNAVGLPEWTEWFEEFRHRFPEDLTLRTIQRKLRKYRGDPGPQSDASPLEAIQPGSRLDITRPLWTAQTISLRYNPKYRRTEAAAEYVERQKEVGNEGDPRKDRILGRFTVWQAVYAESRSKLDKASLTKAALEKLIAAAEDKDYFDIPALKKKADELARNIKA